MTAPAPRRVESYASARDRLATFDVLLFDGKGPISAGIKLASGGPISHVGLVVRADDLDLVCVYESTTLSTVRDEDTLRHVRGVQVVNLSKRLATYDGRVYWRRLVGPRTTAQLRALADTRREFEGRPYETNALDLVRARYDGPFGEAPRDLSSLFCSELAGETWRRCGILPTLRNPGELTPLDFSTWGRDGADNVEHHLAPGYTLEAEVRLALG